MTPLEQRFGPGATLAGNYVYIPASGDSGASYIPVNDEIRSLASAPSSPEPAAPTNLRDRLIAQGGVLSGEPGNQFIMLPSEPGSGPQYVALNDDGTQRQLADDDLFGSLGGALGTVGLGSLGFGVGGVSGASLATGNGITPQTVALDAAGLAGGYGLAGAGLGTPAATSAAGATGLGTTGAAASGGGEAALGSGLTIGGGSQGLSLGATGASGISGTGAAGTALAPGYFASETAYPILGGAAAAGGATSLGSASSGANTAGGAAAAAAPWYTNPNILGAGALTLGSIIGDKQIADANSALADKYMALGAPSRQRYEESFNPNFDVSKMTGLQQAMDTSYQGLLRGLSTQGNPYGNPGALTEAQKYITGNLVLPTLQNYRNQNAATGGFGAFSTAAPQAASNAINASGNIYSDIGRGIGNALNPPPTLDQYFRQLASGRGLA